MSKASEELLTRTVNILWEYGWSERELMVLLGISGERIRRLKELKE